LLYYTFQRDVHFNGNKTGFFKSQVSKKVGQIFGKVTTIAKKTIVAEDLKKSES